MLPSSRHSVVNCITQVWNYLEGVLNSQSGLKVLLCDEAVLYILSVAYSQQELLKHGVVLVDVLSSTKRTPMKHFPCVILCRPIYDTLVQVCQELAEGNFSSYSLHFSTMISSNIVQSLAAADIHQIVSQVHEVYVDSVPITEWVAVSHLMSPVGAPTNSQSPPFYNPLSCSVWPSETLARFSQSIISFVLSSNRRPIIRYRGGGNKLVEELVDDLAVRMSTVHRSFPDLSTSDTVLLVLDRLDDPVTPLLMPWTYEAMIHELIGFHRGNEVLLDVDTGGNIKSESTVNNDSTLSSPDESRHILTPHADTFFGEHRYDDWGQVCLAVSEMVKAYKEMNQFDRSTVSLEEIKNFMSQFPEAKKKSMLVTRHCTLASEMLAEINGRGLTKLSMLEQDMIANNSLAEHTQQVLEAIQDPKTDMDDALRLAMIYCLHYEKAGAGLNGGTTQVKEALRTRRCPTELMKCFDHLLEVAGEEHRLHNIFKNSSNLFKSVAKAVGQFGREVQSVLTSHTPLLRRLINRAYNGTLELDRYPIKEIQGYPTPANQAPYIKGKHIIVVLVGGVTYAEAMILAQANNRQLDNNLESLRSLGKTVSRRLGVDGGAGSNTSLQPPELRVEGPPTAKIEARVSLLSTAFINSKEFIQSFSRN